MAGWINRLSLRAKATMVVLAIIMLALGVTAAVSVVVSNREIAAGQRRTVDAMAQSLARAAELALAVRDEEELGRLASGFMSDRNVVFVAMYDDKGGLLRKSVQDKQIWESYSNSKRETEQFLLSERSVELNPAGSFDVSEATNPTPALVVAPRTVGRVIVAISTQPMNDAQQRQTLLIGGIALAAALISALLTHFAASSWARRLNAFVAASEYIARGDYSRAISSSDSDEIGRLATALEQMRVTLQHRENELRQFNQTLQQRVEERTRELEGARGAAERLAVSFREAGTRIRAIFDTAADGIITMNEEGAIESLNAAAEKIFGYSPHEALNTKISLLIPSLGFYKDAEAARIGLRNFIGARREVDGRRHDGTTFPIELNVSVVELSGKPVFTGIVRDVTAIREAQHKLEAANRQLLQASRQAGMAEVATGVLHNVGNVLNSVNVSATLIAELISNSKITGLEKATRLLNEHTAELGRFVTVDEQGKQIPAYLSALAVHLQNEQRTILHEVELLTRNIEHIKDIVSMQQAYAGASGVSEKILVTDLVEDALRMNSGALARHDIVVVRNYQDAPEINIDKHKVLQVLVNFIRNAKYAMDEGGPRDPKRLTLSVSRDSKMINITVQDNGVGISAENLSKIFTHGFTTRETGHGFGLHSGALAAKELGGEISVKSDGAGKGASFTISLPCELASDFESKSPRAVSGSGENT